MLNFKQIVVTIYSKVFDSTRSGIERRSNALESKTGLTLFFRCRHRMRTGSSMEDHGGKDTNQCRTSWEQDQETEPLSSKICLDLDLCIEMSFFRLDIY